jgi:hypothetical protein
MEAGVSAPGRMTVAADDEQAPAPLGADYRICRFYVNLIDVLMA